ncbi:class I SAM-dependent DNA methyltransferase [Candidatus Pacearchaeota archaeon]|nr:class I SAM-dependent DNA methyltransferase [Candidatus Pacearchaeota archaeon]
MNIAQIEINLQKLINTLSRDTFIYDLLLAYGQPKASITRLKKGNLNLSKQDGEVSWKKKVLFKEEYIDDLHFTISELAENIKHDQRFVIVTDFKKLLATDTKTKNNLEIDLKDLPKYYDFFLPWAGMEKTQHQNENPADVKAAEKMAKLFDEIKKDNPDDSPEYIHGLNVFLCRLLFCLFAEDTNIFKENLFTSSISSHTQTDGSDLNEYLDKLFETLNIPEDNRRGLPAYLNDFPYVNGGLFAQTIKSPELTRRSRQAIISGGELDWSEINPDIFGSMIQAVFSPENRGELGMHYTSVPNIMKVIKPLFLDELYEELEKAGNNKKKLNMLLERLYRIRIFDPACGSGNFLIIAYKELRKLEMAVFKAGTMMNLSGISLTQFYGIEIDDFAHEIAMLSLWLAEHQMNVEFFKEFGKSNPTLPLKDAGNIVHGNACKIKWSDVCLNDNKGEIFILGNPPYQGFKMQSDEQKSDMIEIFKNLSNFKLLDYISCWFYLSSQYIEDNVRVAFVSTNSICQGIQVEMLWPKILNNVVEIYLAHTPFKWTNSAKGNAGVTCIIIGLRRVSSKPKFIVSQSHYLKVRNINAYLVDSDNIIINKRKNVLSDFPLISDGSGALDGGHLIVSDDDKVHIEMTSPEAIKYIRPYTGSNEYIKGINRWCFWIDDADLDEAIKINEIKDRIYKVKNFRINAGTRAQTAINRPHKFAWINVPKETQIIIPTVSSERREYIPIGFLKSNTIVSNSASIIHDPKPYIFGIISSKIHMVWVKAVAGKLEERIRYTSAICYNTFPFPYISSQHQEEINQCAFRILSEREKYPELTMAQLYDPDKMPDELREAHKSNDIAVERCYRAKTFDSDKDRLEFLFKLYENMIADEQKKGTLFQQQKKPRKRKKSNA